MKQIVAIYFLLFYTSIYGQISEGGQPLSFSLSFNQNIEMILLTPPQLNQVKKEDSINDNQYRVALNIPCQISTHNNGTWQNITNTYKIWRLNIKIPEAKGLGLYFEDWINIPENSKLFIYNKSKTQVLGAYTSNTPPFKAVEVVVGDELIIEYQTPINSIEIPNFNITQIAYFYRGFESKIAYFNHSINQQRNNGSCEVNVACEEGSLWQKQIDATIFYTFKEGQYTYVCTASIINNTNFNCKPYILTADHCGHPTTSSQISTNVWYFNYQNPNCEVGSTIAFNGNLTQTMSGGTLKSSSSLGNHSANNNQGVNGSDFVLIELSAPIPESYHPYFAGWNLGGTPSNSGVCIHHPGGSDKKISTYASQIFNTTYNELGDEPLHWGVTWVTTQNGHGVTEGGSSGSPLFNSKGQVVGILSGGSATCDSPSSSDLFGKFNFAWASEGNNTNQQLKYWLDSTSTNYNSINGSYYPCSNTLITDSTLIKNLIDIKIYPNPTPNILYVDLLNLTDSITQLSITDLTGKLVYSIQQPQGILIVNFTDFAIGTYFVKIEGGSEILIKKIIKL
jgi:hypothetical protein